jgi:uncharacterized protein YdaU (DUF1376 family)
MYWYPFNIADYKSSTAHLSNDEDLAFRRLLDMYYDTELPIPLDSAWLARRIRVSIQAVESVLSDMFERREDGFHHKRCDAEIVKYQAFAESGKRGAAIRWAKNGDRGAIGSLSNPNANHNHNNNKNNNTSIKDSRSPKGSRLSIESLPKDWFEFCKAERPEIDPQRTFQQFRDYWIAKAGKDASKLDWSATWRVWVRNQKIQTGGNGNGKFNVHAAGRESLARALVEEVVGSRSPWEIQDAVPDPLHELLPRSGND